jgi:hypothetical protein
MILRISVSALLFGAGLSAAPAGSGTPTFSKDVAPILYQRCVECHRAGEPAPMPLTTYQEARPWAKAIKQAVLQHVMPPNPDPSKDVKWGDQTWEEMMMGWFTYTVPAAPAPSSTAANGGN